MTSTTPATTTKFNVLSIVGFVLAFLGWLAVVGIILEIVALNQIGRTGERGRKLAIAGIVVGIVVIILNIVLDTTVLPSLMSSVRQ